MIPDEALALGIQQGRTEELAVLVDRYYRPLLGYLYRLIGSKQALAENMIQETFLRVMRGIGLSVVSTLQMQNSVQYRVIGTPSAQYQATPLEPGLEDGYIYIMRQKQPA